MIIRAGTAADCEIVAALIAGFQPLLTSDPGGSGADGFLASVSAQAERRYLESPRYAYLVAELDGKVVGFIAMRDLTHLFHLFVAAGHQRQGIGRALWNAARERACGELGLAAFTVNASRHAVPVYRRFGFVAVAGEVVEHGVRFVPMRRDN